MDCLKGYIGMSEDSGRVESGLYLSALPGISMRSMNKIANSDQRDYEGVFKNVESRAILKLRTFFIAEINRCYKISRKEHIDCLISENRHLLGLPLWYLMGAEFILEKEYSDRSNYYTILDNRNSDELHGEFMNSFLSSLRDAVAGINPHASACLRDQDIIHNELITFIPGTP